MSRHLTTYEEFRNLNIKAEIVRKGSSLVVEVCITVTAPVKGIMKRFKSVECVKLDQFFAGLREMSGPLPPEPVRADVLDLSSEEART